MVVCCEQGFKTSDVNIFKLTYFAFKIIRFQVSIENIQDTTALGL